MLTIEAHIRSQPLLLLLTPVILLMFSGCGDRSDSSDAPANTSSPINVVATTSVIGALVEQVGANDVKLSTLIGPGIDPHLYAPSPGDARTISKADLILMIGLDLDNYLLDTIHSANPDAPVVLTTDAIELMEGTENNEHGAIDPHVWQDPIRVKTMVDNIARALSDIDPDRAADYKANASSYKAVLDDTDRQIRDMFADIPPENRKMVTNHDAFEYFAARYDLQIIGTVIPGFSSDAETSAQQLAELSQIIKATHVRAIFSEQLIDPKIAEQLARDTGVQIVTGLYTGQVGEPGSGAETVHAMLLANARKISDALARE